MSKVNLRMFEKGAFSAIAGEGDRDVRLNKKLYQRLVDQNEERRKRIEVLENRIKSLEDQIEDLEYELEKHQPDIDKLREEIEENFKVKTPEEIKRAYGLEFFKNLSIDYRYQLANLLVGKFIYMDLDPLNLWSEIVSDGGVL